MHRIVAWLGLLLALLLPLAVSADTGTAAARIESVYAIPDRHGQLQGPALLAKQALDPAYRLARIPTNLGYPHFRYWAVITVRNDEPRNVESLLLLWRGSAHRQQAWWQHIDAQGHGVGPAHASGFNDLASRHAVLRLPLAAHSRVRVVVALDTATSLSLDYRLMSADTLAATDRIDYLFFGILTGVSGAVAFYVFALFFALRERLYLSFAGFSLSSILYQLHLEGYAYLLWPVDMRGTGNIVSAWLGTSFSLLMAQFIREYLHLADTQPTLDRWVLRPMMVLFATSYGLVLFWPWIGNSVAALVAISSIFLLAGMVVRDTLKHRPVWTFVGGVLLFFASGIIHLLKRLALLPDAQMISLALQLGAAVAVILFAIAVMVRIRRVVAENQNNQQQYAERLQQEVSARTHELSHAKEQAEQALLELQGAQQQLVSAEKMASLGQLVAGVAHEINTPIGIAVTAASHLRDLGTRFANKIDTGKMTRSDLSAWRDASDEASRLILGSLERAHTLIGSFKQVAVDQTSEHRRKFDLADFLGEVVFALQPTYKRSAHTLVIDCPGGITLDTYPGALFQILTNLVNNSLLHAFSEGQQGQMRITVTVDGDRIHLSYRDDGRGMSADVAARAFDPFFTTRRGSGGSGLGLHLVYNLVTRLLGGRIELVSAPGQGSEFRLQFPRHAPVTVTVPDAPSTASGLPAK